MILIDCFVIKYYYYYYALAGYYMYTETSSPRGQGDNAKLQVSVSGNGAAACLVFYYHMYGDTIGALNVYSGNDLVFNVFGNQGNYWIQARETIYLRNSVSYIKVNFHGDFAPCKGNGIPILEPWKLLTCRSRNAGFHFVFGTPL